MKRTLAKGRTAATRRLQRGGWMSVNLNAIPESTRKANPIAAAQTRAAYQNHTYSVQVWLDEPKAARPYPLIHLLIRRNDGEEICAPWDELQRIKNDIVGPDHEAIELYPCESRCVRAASMRHLFVHVSPGHIWPVGWGVEDAVRKGGAS